MRAEWVRGTENLWSVDLGSLGSWWKPSLPDCSLGATERAKGQQETRGDFTESEKNGILKVPLGANKKNFLERYSVAWGIGLNTSVDFSSCFALLKCSPCPLIFTWNRPGPVCAQYRWLHSHTVHPLKVACLASIAISSLFKMENVIKFLNNSRVQVTIQCPFWGSLWCKWKHQASLSGRVDLRFTM